MEIMIEYWVAKIETLRKTDLWKNLKESMYPDVVIAQTDLVAHLHAAWTSVDTTLRLKSWTNWVWAQGLGHNRNHHFGLNKNMIRKISRAKCYFWLYTPKNWEFRTIYRLAACNDRHPCTGLGLQPYTIITHLVNMRQTIESFCKECFFSSDEAHFWLNGYVNKQNCRIWSEANPQVYVETPLHPEKLTVWCALWAGGIIGPHFFKNDEGHNVTVNGDWYRAMITNFFIPELNNHDVQELWFQQEAQHVTQLVPQSIY
ncbi:DUF4817 domain-containing protein [Trichonephila clavipes]|nr:DUF4817 domain-containing protein [Trichonephila clavipes]